MAMPLDNEKLDPRVLEKLKDILEDMGLKPIYLAQELKYSASWSSHLMGGKRGLTVNQLIKIAEILNIHPSALLPDLGRKPEFSLAEYIRLIIKEELHKEENIS